MTREISRDGNVLINYLKEFDLRNYVDTPSYISHLKSMHKKAYGYLLFVAELEQQTMERKFVSELTILYFKETGSDIMQSIFCWTTGSYKTAHIMLRSSIETFLKAILGNDNEAIYDEKSIYKLFEKASEHPFFISEIGKEKYIIIHGIYKELCMIAHSAKNIDLGTIASFNLLPRYDQELSTKYNSVFLKQLDAFLGTILLNYSANIYRMHSLNNSIFLSSISLSIKRRIFESIEQNNPEKV